MSNDTSGTVPFEHYQKVTRELVKAYKEAAGYIKIIEKNHYLVKRHITDGWHVIHCFCSSGNVHHQMIWREGYPMPDWRCPTLCDYQQFYDEISTSGDIPDIMT